MDSPWWDKRPAAFALVLTLLFLLLTSAVAFALVPHLKHPEAKVQATSKLHIDFVAPSVEPAYLLNHIWQRYDSFWFQRIAARGYEDVSVPFYPLFPALVGVLHKTGLPTDWSALVVGRGALFLALWGLILLFRLDYGNETASAALGLLLCWPMTFILLSGYSESCLLAATVWSIYFARQGRWWPAAACAVAACLARSVGMALLPALGWLAFRANPRPWLQLAFACTGPLWFPSWLHISGLPQPGVVYPVHWRTQLAPPWETLAAAVQGVRADDGTEIVVILNWIALISVTALLMTTRLPAEYKIFSFASLGFVLCAKSTPALHSTVRYVVPLFPIYLALALRLKKRGDRIVAGGLLAGFSLVLLFGYFDWLYIV